MTPDNIKSSWPWPFRVRAFWQDVRAEFQAIAKGQPYIPKFPPQDDRAANALHLLRSKKAVEDALARRLRRRREQGLSELE
jgi:hypothetical protein